MVKNTGKGKEGGFIVKNTENERCADEWLGTL